MSGVPAKLTLVTLGARDHPALRDFYAGWGWPLAVDMEGFAVFELTGAVLALFALDELAADGRVEATSPDSGIGFSLAINVERREEVDETVEAARAAGARVTKEPTDAEWGGRSAYFADPEDNYWEVAWVPPDSKVAAVLRQAVGGS